MPEYRIPCRWEMADSYRVEADSLEAAIEMIDTGKFEASIANGTFIDGSFEVDQEMAEFYAEEADGKDQGSEDPLEG